MLMVSALAVCGMWMVMAIALIGMGAGSLAVFHRNDGRILEELWMGLAVGVALLEIWNLVLPINSWATISLFGLGTAGILVNWGSLSKQVRAIWSGRGWWMLVPAGLVLILAIRACGPCDYGDTGLYGWPAVRWASSSAAVPGLGNLHGRLGYNSAIFLCVAALDQGVWKGRAHHLFTGFLMSAMALAVLPGVVRLMRRTSISASDWFLAILGIPVVFWVTRTSIVGTETDEPATIACLAGAGILFSVLCARRGEGDLERDCSRLMVAAGLFAVAVAFKESTIVFGLLAWCLAMAWIWRQEAGAGRRRVYLLGSVALSVAVVLPWCVRGIILSGYPFFPATILGFPVDWKIPLEQARWFADGVKSFGRNPNANFFRETQGLGWLGGWLKQVVRDRVSFQVPMAICLGGMAAGLSLRRKEQAKSAQQDWGSLWLLAASLGGMVFWFWASPALRFGQFAIWTAAAALGTWGIVSVTARWEWLHGIVLGGLLGLCVWCLAGYGWKAPYRALLAARPLGRVPSPEVLTRTTRSGLEVNVPPGINCWDAGVPCTPYFDETLRLRDGVSLRRGFASDGQSEELRKLRLAPLW